MATKIPTVRIDFKGLRSKTAMLEAVSTTLKFPDHFGHNLDALFDCLTDLPLDKRKLGMTIELANLPQLPAARDIAAAFDDAAAFWQERGRTLAIHRTKS
jgi:RNAse (barnase) inhibitor barstar